MVSEISKDRHMDGEGRLLRTPSGKPGVYCHNIMQNTKKSYVQLFQATFKKSYLLVNLEHYSPRPYHKEFFLTHWGCLTCDKTKKIQMTTSQAKNNSMDRQTNINQQTEMPASICLPIESRRDQQTRHIKILNMKLW